MGPCWEGWVIEIYLAFSHHVSLYVRIFLLECNVREVRVAVATILEKTLDSALLYQDKVSLVF